MSIYVKHEGRLAALRALLLECTETEALVERIDAYYQQMHPTVIPTNGEAHILSELHLVHEELAELLRQGERGLATARQQGELAGLEDGWVEAMTEVRAVTADWLGAYPEDLFPPLVPGEEPSSVDRVSAGMARHVLRHLQKLLGTTLATRPRPAQPMLTSRHWPAGVDYKGAPPTLGVARRAPLDDGARTLLVRAASEILTAARTETIGRAVGPADERAAATLARRICDRYIELLEQERP